METLAYLYAIVPADAADPAPELTGIDGGAVRLVRGERVCAVVSDVAETAYADEVLDARLADLAWVGERGLAHERVLDWYAERGPVIPLSLFSLHRDDQRVGERIAAEAERYERLLDRLRGHREWGVKLWRDDARLAEHLGELSPAVAALTAEIETAPPGRRFLLEKKRDALSAEELRRVSARVSHEVYGQLRGEARDSVTIPITAPPGNASRTLVLYGAFLVPDEGFAGFQRRLSELAAAFQPTGFDFEFTGPWPPYHFADPDAA
ncbi:MAG: GvpL/GvpF family gas vesicle protein [Gemmatimonadetes bacterium]|nr:GvpL/GvpF family gas vesicle protein [Gemmatimonadota bacterium]